jgi:hypothetical protein
VGIEAIDEPYLDEETGLLWVEAGFHNNWTTYKVCFDEEDELHRVPLGDAGSHLLHQHCHCEPSMADDGQWEHNAYDRREEFELRKRRVS